MKSFGLKFLLILALVCSSGVSEAKEKAKATAKKSDENVSVYQYLNVFSETFKRARTDYVEEVSEDKLIEYAINGMLSSLDPHSSYLDADTFKDMQEQTKGEFGGLGIEVTMDNGWIKVISPIDDTPAHKAGIKAGDYITHIDGTAVLGQTLTEAVDKMRGPVNSKVKLTVRRKGKDPFDVTLSRAVIKIRSVRSEDKGTVGYIRISSFSEATTQDVKKAVAKIQKDHKDNLSGYVLDLRNNPGGLLDQAVSVADLFMDEGEIVSTRPRRPEEMQRYSATKGDITKNMPIVVLINEGSASAAEIVAGALQDHKRAVVVGTRSFGKGSVQTVIPVTGLGAIRLTTARYYTPSGRSIQAKGIEPDIEIQPGHVEYFAQRSDDFAEAALPNALAKQDEKDKAKAKGKKGGKTKEPDPFDEKPREEKKIEDYQLDRAIDIVKAMGIYHSK
ncbi:MAG: S41 family peptidase [Alphaproteobacteria bacterium]|jgi:carboxyl-terminal processing protease